MTKMPILLCYDDGQNFKAWCPLCRRWHYHGRGEGHRVAHCSNFEHFPNGYEIRLAERLQRMEDGKEAGPLRKPIDR